MDASVRRRDELGVSDADPEFRYKWVNSRERNMLLRLHQGYEVVDKPESIPEAVRALNPNLASSTNVRTRGDVVLMRIRHDVHARNVQGPIDEQRARQRGALDDMVASAREKIERQMRNEGKQIPDGGVIFPTDAKPFAEKK